MSGSKYQTVKFLDVGHGDSAVIYLRGDNDLYRKTVVIDVPESQKLLKELEDAEVKIIDLLIITHFDLDHCKGVNDFLQKFSKWGMVKKICYNLDRAIPTKNMKSFLKNFLEIYRRENTQIISGELDTAKMKELLLEWGESKLYLLYPNKAESTKAYLSGKTNDMSIITLLKRDNCSILFSGDLEERGWTSLLQRMPDLTCKIIKMPHHGAYYKGTKTLKGLEEVLTVVRPETAVISVAENKKNHHPDERTIELLKSKGIRVLCTQYTNLCHPEEGGICRKCYGDITILNTDEGYDIATEQERFALCPKCVK